MVKTRLPRNRQILIRSDDQERGGGGAARLSLAGRVRHASARGSILCFSSAGWVRDRMLSSMNG